MGDAERSASSRKRGRSTPQPVSLFPDGKRTAQGNARAAESTDDRVRAAQLRDPSLRIMALNSLLKISSSHEANYALTGDSVLEALLDISVECLQWKRPLLSSSGKESCDNGNDDSKPVFSSAAAWTSPPTEGMRSWTDHCQELLGPKRHTLDSDRVKVLEVIVVIFRNLSFVGANLRMLVYTPDVLALLVGFLYDSNETAGVSLEESSSATGASSGSLSVSAIQTLVHLAPSLDVSGQKLLADKLFYSPMSSRDGPLVPDMSTFGQAAGGSWGYGGLWLAKRLDTKEDVVSDVTKDFLLSITEDYLVGVWSIFPALASVLTNFRSSRPVLMMAVDLLQELINHARIGVVGSVDLEDKEEEIPTIRAVLVNMPDDMLKRLVDLLYVPRLGPDALDYMDPVKNMVTRVTTLRLLMGYDATVDTDVRDRALDVLVPLLELDSPRMAARLGTDPTDEGRPRTRLFDALVPILKTTVGRNEAPLLASQLLRELSKADENRLGLLYIQERLVDLASNDPRVANLIFNHLYLPPEEEEEEEEESEPDENGEETSDDVETDS